MLDISVIINTKDRPESLRLCLAALEAQTLDSAKWEIVIVDDGSYDDSNESVVASFSRNVPCRLIKREHRGCAAARNSGIEAATGRLVQFLGDDVLLNPDVLQEHLSAHEKYPKAAIVGPYELDLTDVSSTFYKYAETRYFKNIRDPQNASWRFFYTGNASVERQILLDIGGFDENFFRYAWEDMDLGVRLERSGIRIVYYPRAAAVHHHPGMTLQSLCRAEFEQSFSAYYFFQKWADEPSVQSDRFWNEDPQSVSIGPSWRRAAARQIIRVTESLLPLPAILKPLYERLLWSCRYEGLREGMAYYDPLLECWRKNEVAQSRQERRFQK